MPTPENRWLVVPAGPIWPYFEPLPFGSSLSALQDHVGGNVDVVALEIPLTATTTVYADLWVGDDWGYTDQLLNPLATLLVKLFAPRTLLAEPLIRGGAVVAAADDEGATIGLPGYLVELFATIFSILQEIPDAHR